MCAGYLINRVFSGYDKIDTFEKKILTIVNLYSSKLSRFKFKFNYFVHHFNVISSNLNYFVYD